MRRLIGAGLAATLCAPGLGLAQPAPADLGTKILPSLVKIITVCGKGGESRIASGFVLNAQGQVVTDLHVVAGCEPAVSVLYFVHDGSTWKQTVRQAVVSKVLRAADLALLTVTDPPGAPPLPVAAQAVAPEQWVEAWGFPLGIQAPTDTRLQVTFANDLFPKLSSTLDDTARAQLQALHFPSLDARVLHLNGPLQPGDSGAPVVNAAGEVVGIGSGGLQQGAASISWAMRGEYLRQLPSSTDALPASTDGSPLFAYVQSAPSASTAASGPETVRCGGLGLVFRGIRTLDQLLSTAPDARAVRRLAAEYKVSLPDLGTGPYAIWIEPKSGAAIVLPPGARLIPGEQFCRAETGRPGIALLIRLTALPRDPSTPEWAFAVGRGQWLTLIALSRTAGSGLHTEARVPGWTRQHLHRGALIRRSVMTGRNGVRVYRADLAGRAASVSVGAVSRDGGAEADKLDWARALAAVELASFPPPDQTQPDDLAASDDSDSAGAPAPEAGPKLYPIADCGQRFLRLSSVPTIGTLAASSPVTAALAARLRDGAGVSLDRIAAAQLDLWGEGASGLVVPVPRGAHPEAAGSACIFTVPGSGARVVLAGYNGDVADRLAEFRTGITAALGLTLRDLHPLDTVPSGPIRVHRWTGEGRYGNGAAVRVAIIEQTRDTRDVIAALIAPSPPDPSNAAALAGLWLAPSAAGP